MASPQSITYVTTPPPLPYERIGFGWGAVLAGLGIAIAIDILFAEIGLAMNLGIIDLESSGGAILTMNALAWVVGGLIALFAGAWVAGRMASARTMLEGSLHGIAVWAAGAVAMLMLAFSAAGVLGSGMLALVGSGLEGAGEVAQVAVPSWEDIREELDGPPLERDAAGIASAARVSAGGDNRLRDRSRLLELAGRRFTVEAGTAPAAEKEEFVELVAARTGISVPAAEQTVAQWDRVWNEAVQGYEAKKAEALRLAEDARLIALAAAGWAAVGMFLGAGAALVGGAYGARSRLRLVELQDLARSELAGAASFPTQRTETGRPEVRAGYAP